MEYVFEGTQLLFQEKVLDWETDSYLRSDGGVWALLMISFVHCNFPAHITQLSVRSVLSLVFLWDHFSSYLPINI